MGFEEIVLVGTDYTLSDYRRFYDGDPDAPRRLEAFDMATEIEQAHRGFDVLTQYLKQEHPSVKILNCSPLSDLPHFEKPSLASVIRL